MNQEFEKHSNKINNAFRDLLLERESEPTFVSSIPSLCNLFTQYVPMKERSFLLFLIANGYDIKFEDLFFNSLGVEVLFVSYYAKDDIIDSRLELKDDLIKKFLLFDYLNELGHSLVCSSPSSSHYSSASIINAFSKLIKGQYLGECFSSIKQMSATNPIVIPYFKAGALFESMIDVFRVYSEKISLSELSLLKEISKSIGTYLQIKNDIQDFLIDTKSTDKLRDKNPLEDLMFGKYNYVLCKYIQSKHSKSLKLIESLWGNQYKSITDVEKTQDEVFFALEEENVISSCIIDINAEIGSIKNKIKALENDKIKSKLNKYTEFILSVY